MVSSGTYSFSFSEIELFGELQVEHSWKGQQICAILHSPFIETNECVSVDVVEEVDGGFWFSVPVETIVGSGRIMMRWQRTDLFLPLGIRPEEYDFSTEIVPLGADRSVRPSLRERFTKNQKDWGLGKFVLLRDGEIKGAIEFQAEQAARIMVFDQLWLTPEVQQTVESVDGTELVLQFPVEPNFKEDELAVLRVHPFFFRAVVPMGEQPSSAEQSYLLQPKIPEFSVLEEKMMVEVEKANRAEKAWVTAEAQLLLEPLHEKETCQNWSKSKEVEMIWIGYDIGTIWNGQRCVLQIAPELEQHRRRFSGEIQRE